MRKGLQNILNISFTDTQWLQATLPIRVGGLGIRRAESLAISAFLASAAFTSEIQSNILGALIIQPYPHYSNLSEHWQALTELSLTDHFPANSQDKLDAPLLQKEHSFLLQSSPEPNDLARLKPVSFQHSGDWLNCLPITSCGLRLRDEAIRVAVGLRLGANIIYASLIHAHVERWSPPKAHTVFPALLVSAAQHVTLPSTTLSTTARTKPRSEER